MTHPPNPRRRPTAGVPTPWPHPDPAVRDRGGPVAPADAADVTQVFDRITTDLDLLVYRVRRTGRSIPPAALDDAYDALTRLRDALEEL